MPDYGYWEERAFANDPDTYAYDEVYEGEGIFETDKLRSIWFKKTEEGTVTVVGFFITRAAYDYFNVDSIEIPDNISDLPVTTVAAYASSHCAYDDNDADIVNVTLPNTLKTIGRAAFSNLDMKSVEIPASVTEIGEYAFGYLPEYDKNGHETGFEKIDDFMIYCYPGTAGERYAKDNDFKYTLIGE